MPIKRQFNFIVPSPFPIRCFTKCALRSSSFTSRTDVKYAYRPCSRGTRHHNSKSLQGIYPAFAQNQHKHTLTERIIALEVFICKSMLNSSGPLFTCFQPPPCYSEYRAHALPKRPKTTNKRPNNRGQSLPETETRYIRCV